MTVATHPVAKSAGGFWQREAVQRWLALASVYTVALIAYARSFAVPFQFDDFDQVVGNPMLQAPTLTGLIGWARARVVPFATLAFNYQLGGESTFGYHVVNFAVHLASTFFVFRLALALCDTPRLRASSLRPRRLALATAAALVFACHPIQVQAVTYIVQRMTSMAAMFYLGAVFFYVSARNSVESPAFRRAAYGAALLFALAAFASKENAATLPLAIGLTEIVFYGATRGAIVRLIPFVALVLIIPLAWAVFWPSADPGGLPLVARLAAVARHMAVSVDSAGRASPGEYFLTQCLVIPRYLALVLVPVGFTVDHDVPVAHAWSPAVGAGLALLLALLVIGIAGVRRAPLIGYGLLWMLLTLSVESSLLPIADVMMEHRMYLPMAGVALLSGAGFAWAFTRAPWPSIVGGAMVVALLVAATRARNEIWRSPLSLWQEAVVRSPDKARPHLNLGTVLHQQGRLEEAIPHYCKALEIDPGSKVARANLDLLLDQRLDAHLDDRHDDREIDLTAEAAGPQVKVLTPSDPCKRE